jgi:hypothetical protein
MFRFTESIDKFLEEYVYGDINSPEVILDYVKSLSRYKDSVNGFRCSINYSTWTHDTNASICLLRCHFCSGDYYVSFHNIYKRRKILPYPEEYPLVSCHRVLFDDIISGPPDSSQWRKFWGMTGSILFINSQILIPKLDIISNFCNASIIVKEL